MFRTARWRDMTIDLMRTDAAIEAVYTRIRQFIRPFPS
jgi:hypothetical protein